MSNYFPIDRTSNAFPSRSRTSSLRSRLIFLSLAFLGVPAAWGQMPQNFIAVAPCRIADTRTASGGQGPIQSQTYRSFTVTGSCSIPATATAYSLNVTAVPPSGEDLLYVSVLPGTASTSGPPTSSTLNDPSGTLIANAALVQAGNGGVLVYVSATSDIILDIDGYFVDQTSGSSDNTGVGTGAIGSNTGTNNTAVGLNSIGTGTGSYNTGVGNSTLSMLTTGTQNVAVGYNAMQDTTTGQNDTGLGEYALRHNTTGSMNTAVGEDALLQNTDSSDNTALGASALANVTTGSASNLALGYSAGSNLYTGSNNIYLSSNSGANNESGVVRIGTQGTQTAFYAGGIYNETVTGGAAVVVNSSGQLGVQSSSIRFKEDVKDMDAGSDALMKLRPVQFRYKQAEADGTKPLQFGLVAEEVAKVYPELVVKSKDGQIDAVQYHQLPAMLLNEIQKQHRTIDELQGEIEVLRAQVANK